ncbi:unnamed protein product [Allacma fusca]|uniref:Uncharacterized protein n=1 Tax=Allacma fusca TaxID=39272 RepID=A0A8J2L6F5_9HEXA|nr:unnamed protein product [Allacma fusca]
MSSDPPTGNEREACTHSGIVQIRTFVFPSVQCALGIFTFFARLILKLFWREAALTLIVRWSCCDWTKISLHVRITEDPSQLWPHHTGLNDPAHLKQEMC